MSLTRNERIMRAVEHLEEVRRQAQLGQLSRQPRFGAAPEEKLFSSIYYWVQQSANTAPSYQADSRARDSWLCEYWKKEPHLAGVIDSVVNIDKNRAWALTGGRNQVKRYTDMLRDAEAGQGWRYYMSQQAQNFYTTDIGAITELGRDGTRGPVRALFTLDSVLCHLTGNPERPLRYDNNKQAWLEDDFFRVVSLPSSREQYNGLGYCAVSRVLEMAQLMIAVYEHDQEMLGARSPKGLLLLKGIDEEQWETAMQARNAVLSQREQDYYGGVSVLASQSDDIDAKLVALSQLPQGFDIKITTDLLMYTYALCFGYDAIEFWPVSQGALGRGRETEIQHQKATGKGGADFMLSFQDRLQMVLPETLLFEFEQRDAQGMVMEAQVIQAWANVANALYQNGAGVLTREQAASMLVANGIIPAEWTHATEDSMATDTEDVPDEETELEPGAEVTQGRRAFRQARLRQVRQQALEDERVRRAAERYPREPIVRYRWSPGYPNGRTTVLWEHGEEAVAWRSWQMLKPVTRSLVQRQEDEVLYEAEDFTITEADVEAAIVEGGERVGEEFGAILRGRTLTEEEMGELEGNDG